MQPEATERVEPQDHDEIDTLLRAAFPTDEEARLVHKLRADGDMWLEMKKSVGGRIAGYYAISRMRAPEGWGCLAPVAVLPAFQGGKLVEQNPNWEAAAGDEECLRGPLRIGSRMMRELAAWHAMPGMAAYLPETIVVLGEPSFYERAGFSRARAARLTSPYPIDFTLILRRGTDVPEGELVYPAAFSAL
ncbi:GNAT family N-acetyltransferase [Marimonas arenosa]|uniref:N-acetyltransferase n=1 Tax=Marimonas arenosa TaxID=1795305 RepID=A0AAE3WEK1_9RHOB|nr:N-acetyltransferase [Marimonas arenosa]MDQ2090208.1 N-acetyltransferase [Marimonas arenosa]